MVCDNPPVATGAGMETGLRVQKTEEAYSSTETGEHLGQATSSATIRAHKQPSLVWLLISRVILPLVVVIGAAVGFVRLRAMLAPRVEVANAVAQLRAGGQTRWQAVAYLTPFIYDQRYDDLRRDPALAEALADCLTEELQQPLAGYSDMSIAARAHLCRLIRRMDVPTVIPCLAKAVRWRGGGSPEMDSPVRKAAAEGLYELGERLGPEVLHASPDVLPALLIAVDDPVDPVRSVAALALGLHGGPEACAKLQMLLGDPNPAVRYNAAIGLAMAGDAAGIATLAELFHSKETEKLATTGNLESINGMRTRQLLVLGLRSVNRLMDMDPTAPVDNLRPVLSQLQYSLVPEDVKQLAFQVEVKINQRAVR
ncbi:HEAT repeat domain-containing protein [Thermogutta sp.]|uniref:HEAT repeat domain-containing protein n=1 Tax=Thermogutta sp. TaxID=1962930 RepID=UPI00322095D7